MNFNFREFLKSLNGMDRQEIIDAASRESMAAKDYKVKDGGKYKTTRLKQQDYISDVGDFLYFVRTSDNSGMSWPEAYLASPEWLNKQRARNLDFS